MNILAVEASTSSAKALLYSSDKGVLKSANIAFSKDICDTATQDSGGIFRALIKAIKKISEASVYKIDAISICTTWHSILLLDKNRKPIDRIITWANNEAAETTTKYRKNESFSNWYYNKTGCMVNCTYPYWQYIHYKNTYPEKIKDVAFLSSQQEFIFEQLTGEIAASKSTASGSGFFNIHSLDWDDDLLEYAAINRAQMSELKEPRYFAPLKGDVAKELELTEGIPVLVGNSDGGMNQLGAGGMEKGIMTLSIGTSGALRVISEKPLIYAKPATWCYYLGDNMRILGAATSGAGNCVDWFVNNFCSISGIGFDVLEKLLFQISIENAPIFLPFLYGERCPGWKDDRTGGFKELKAAHSIGDMYYAILEGILFNLYQCYKTLTCLVDEPQQIRISGGILRSEFWTQMAADVFQKEVIVSDFEHQSLLGAAVYALNILQNSIPLCFEVQHLGRKVIPNQSLKNLYSRRYKKYIEIYSV